MFLKMMQITRKVPVLKFLFNKVAGPWPTTSLKRKSITSIFLRILQKIQEHFLYRIPRKDCSFDVTN